MKTISGVVALALVGIAGFFSYQHMGAQPAHAQAAPAARFPYEGKVAADLGGMHVKIPNYFAQFFETEPQKADQNGLPVINSFGFYVRFPDMTGLSSPALEKEKRDASIDTTQWIFVGIDAGAYSGDGLFLERISQNVNGDGILHFERKNEDEFGLATFTPIGISSADRQKYNPLLDDKDIFIERDASGKVQTYIECSNVMHEAAPCSHFFFLPPPVKGSVEVSYRRGLLKDWRAIKSSVTKLILGFGDPAPLQSQK